MCVLLILKVATPILQIMPSDIRRCIKINDSLHYILSYITGDIGVRIPFGVMLLNVSLVPAVISCLNIKLLLKYEGEA